MAKLKHLAAVIIFLTSSCFVKGQSYEVRYKTPEGDSINNIKGLLQKTFASRIDAGLYVQQLPAELKTKGYLTASIDSLELDSSFGIVTLFLGEKYQWANVQTRKSDDALLDAIRFPRHAFSGTVDLPSLQLWQQKILDYLEENGHPFGKVYLDSIGINGAEVNALLKIDPGPLYKIDSISIHGDVKVSKQFLQNYLDLPDGSVYNRKKLEGISRKIASISYLQEERSPDLTLLGEGSILNLYLKAKKNSQANVLIGLQPNSDQLTGDQKLMLTVDANILLRNALGSGETIGLIWQQLQQKSPRLNLLFDQPYAFHSPFGLNFSFDMYKKDSAFLNVTMNLGTSYRLEERQTARVFLQRRQSIVSAVNIGSIMQTRKLPQEIDVSSLNLGVGYTFLNTDLLFNPRKGNDVTVTATAGNKKIRKNSQILEIKDPSDPSFDYGHLYDTVKLNAFQFRMTGTASHYIPFGTQSTIKLAMNAGIYESANYFRNELFQIGGIKLLRGFDEESQYVSQYAIGTAEYRYRMGLNSFFFVFADGGWGKHQLELQKDHTYFGTGIGLSFETKAGMINLAWAVGRRDDTEFNLRQSKVHVGFAGYF
jgi:outer membrane protein assembly factor BamA